MSKPVSQSETPTEFQNYADYDIYFHVRPTVLEIWDFLKYHYTNSCDLTDQQFSDSVADVYDCLWDREIGNNICHTILLNKLNQHRQQCQCPCCQKTQSMVDECQKHYDFDIDPSLDRIKSREEQKKLMSYLIDKLTERLYKNDDIDNDNDHHNERDEEMPKEKVRATQLDDVHHEQSDPETRAFYKQNPFFGCFTNKRVYHAVSCDFKEHCQQCAMGTMNADQMD